MGAALACCGKVGHLGVTAEDIAGRCGMSLSTFYRYFVGVEECLEQAYEEQVMGLLQQPLMPTENATAQLAQALERLAAFIVEDPLRARAVLVEARLAAGPPFQRRQQFLARLSAWLDALCRPEAGRRPPAVAATFLVGGIEQLAIQALSRNRPHKFADDIPGLVFLIASTYGMSAAGVGGPEVAGDPKRPAQPNAEGFSTLPKA